MTLTTHTEMNRDNLINQLDLILIYITYYQILRGS